MWVATRAHASQAVSASCHCNQNFCPPSGSDIHLQIWRAPRSAATWVDVIGPMQPKIKSLLKPTQQVYKATFEVNLDMSFQNNRGNQFQEFLANKGPQLESGSTKANHARWISVDTIFEELFLRIPSTTFEVNLVICFLDYGWKHQSAQIESFLKTIPVSLQHTKLQVDWDILYQTMVENCQFQPFSALIFGPQKGLN